MNFIRTYLGNPRNHLWWGYMVMSFACFWLVDATFGAFMVGVGLGWSAKELAR